MSLGFYRPLLPVLALAVCSGCLPQLPENAKPSDSPQRGVLMEMPDGLIETESDVDNAVWLEVNRSTGNGTVGGYLSRNESPFHAVAIILHGASTFSLEGQIGSARIFHETFGKALQDAGYVTWSLAYQECGTPYGQGDLQDVLDAIDWIQRVGKDALGFERVYVSGYSTGGTLTILTNRHRAVSAIASVSGLTEPESIEDLWGLFKWITGLYPLNLGACQMGDTLNFYGAPGSPGWGALDTVSHIEELRSPMLLLHGNNDPIFSVDNAHDLENRYNEVLAGGGSLPELKFLYFDREGHFPDLARPEVTDPIIAFFGAHQDVPATQPGS